MAESSGWRAEIARRGKAEFIRQEMLRLGFWSEELERDPPGSERAIAALRERIAALEAAAAPERERLQQLNRLLGQSAENLLAGARRARIERVRQERAERAKAREVARAQAQEQDRAWRQRTLPHLGRGVSTGLSYTGGNPERLESLGLPTVATAEELAAAIGITTGELAWLTYHRGVSMIDHYQRFTIPKRSGGQRVISSPKSRLRVAQRWVLDSILARVPVEPQAMGFRAGMSVLDNAAQHAARPLVVRMDLADFFPSITFPRVRGLFQGLGYNRGIATLLALLCTEAPRATVEFEGQRRHVAVGDRQLPQGACTSPALTNVLCRRLDRRLTALAASFGCAYTRYADDLVFSHPRADAPLGQLLSTIRRVLNDEGFTVNEAKTAVMRSQHRQVVTGLVVNDAPRVSRADRRRFRALLHQIDTGGTLAPSVSLGRDVLAYARGYLAFVQMAQPALADRLRSRYTWLQSGHDSRGDIL